LKTTQYSRGTQGYRAPEVLRDKARYNNKADIFALGCILYEVTTAKKLFASDWEVREYSHNIGSVPLWPPSTAGTKLHSLGRLAKNMLSVDPLLRPSARDVRGSLVNIRLGFPPNLTLAAPPTTTEQIRLDIPPSVTNTIYPSVHPRYRRLDSPGTEEGYAAI
jgi:serine/threonine protein kinase